MQSGPALVVVLLLTVGMPPASAMAQAPSSGAVQERASAVVIEIPVNVIGKDGKPIDGLDAKDFELYDDGKKQAIHAVDVIDLSGTAAAPPGAALAPIPASARRLWLLVFDMSYTSMSALLRARAGARKFVTESMAASDLAAVGTLSLDTGWKLLVNFTRDRSQLTSAIDTMGLPGLSVRSADPLGFAFVTPGVIGASASGLAGGSMTSKDSEFAANLRDMQALQVVANDEQARGRVAKLMNALGAMGRALDAVRGRKHVLYFSEGFETRLLAGRTAGNGPAGSLLQQGASASALDPSTNQGAADAAVTGQIWKVDSDARFGNTSLQNQLTSSLALFPRSDAVLDAVDIGGVHVEVDAAGPKPGSGTDALSAMASETGGDFVRNANELGGELHKIAERTGRVYLLVYQPQGLSKPGAFHKLRVDVKVPASRVLARSGYYEPRTYGSLTPLERLLASGDLVTGGSKGDGLEGRLVVAPFASPAEAAQVPVVLELPGAALLAGEKGEKTGVQIYAYATDASGTLADYVASDLALDLAKTRPALEAGGIKFYGTLYLPPGDYGVRVLARNATTGRAGIFSATVKVPVMPGGTPTVLPPFFQEPAGRWVMVRASARADAPQRAADYPFAVSGEAFIPSVLPVVTNGSEARIAVFTYNFGGGGKTGPLAARGEIVGADGQARPVTMAIVKASDAERGGGRKLLLSWSPEGLAPGRYALKVAVTDPASKATGEGTSEVLVR